MDVAVDLVGLPQVVDPSQRHFVVQVSPFSTFHELRVLACRRAGVSLEEARLHYKGKVYPDATTVGQLRGNRSSNTLKVALMPDPSAKRQTMDQELRRLREAAKQRYDSSSPTASSVYSPASDQGSEGRSPFSRTEDSPRVGDFGRIRELAERRATPSSRSPKPPAGARSVHTPASAPRGDGTDHSPSSVPPSGRAREEAAADARRRIEAKARECQEFERELSNLERFGTADDATRQRLIFLSETFERALLFFDGVDSLGDDDVRACRKAAVRRVDALSDRANVLKNVVDDNLRHT